MAPAFTISAMPAARSRGARLESVAASIHTRRGRRKAPEQGPGVELVQNAGGGVREDAADEIARLGAAFQQMAQHAAEAWGGGFILGQLPGLLLLNVRVAGGNLGVQGRQGIGDHVVVHVFGKQGDGLVHGGAQGFGGLVIICLRAGANGVAIAARHVRAGCRLIQEHQPLRRQAGLRGAPLLARLLHVGPILLAGVQRFF